VPLLAEAFPLGRQRRTQAYRMDRICDANKMCTGLDSRDKRRPTLLRGLVRRVPRYVPIEGLNER
jgi:hypothetical protein